MSNPWDVVRDFERAVADFAGCKYGVAVDTCTAALHLSLEYSQRKFKCEDVTIPYKTYVSVPCMIKHMGLKITWSQVPWKGWYLLSPHFILDSACRFSKNMCKEGFASECFTCVSFQYRKHLPIGRGGMILHNNDEADKWFRLARFSGRHEVPLTEDVPEMIGWHYFMEPERAARGLQLLSLMKTQTPDDLEFQYPDLRTFGLY